MRVAEFDLEALSEEPVGSIRFGIGEDGRAWEAHVCSPGGVVAGNLGPRWTVESVEPLTVSPSIHCQACGLHGWIREDAWVPA